VNCKKPGKIVQSDKSTTAVKVGAEVAKTFTFNKKAIKT
jgi:hypothetical protein